MLKLCDDISIMLAIEPVDFRKGARSLLALCKEHYKQSVEQNIWYVFTNRRYIAIKILCIDDSGCWLATKYFDKGKLAFWPTSSTEMTEISSEQLQLIAAQKHPISANYSSAIPGLSRDFILTV